MVRQKRADARALGWLACGLTALPGLAGCGGEDALTVAQTNDVAAVQDQVSADAADTEADAAPDDGAGADAGNGQDSSPADGNADDASTPDSAESDAGSSDTTPPDTQPQCSSDADCAASNPCLLGVCSPSGTCQTVAKADATPCDDGNACTKGDSCQSGVCTGGAAVACDDDNPCTADKCNPISGCLNLPVTATTDCDDGDPCTQGDACLAGKCEAGVNTCQCQTSGDCAKFEDGNLCNGSLYCDKSAGPPYLCKLNPASLVVCPSGADSACQKNTCIPATGACKLVVAPANTPCDDGDSCTTGDFCDTGLCQGGANTCACKQDADCVPHEDGNACNGTLFCNKALAQCQVNPVTVVTCQTVDDTACLQNLCNPKEGKCYLLPVHEGKACDDGNPCTPNETCSSGQCTTATNTCDCQSDADCAAKEDGNLCNGTLYCDVAAHVCRTNPATVVHCNTDDDPACLGDVCDPKSGKCSEIALPKDGTACDDGNPCTALSLCSGGKCKGQANLCQCQKDADCAGKDDGDLCNGSLFCNPASNFCEVNPATVVECPSAFDEACLTNQCDPATGGCGMKPAHQGNQCDDNSLCSGGGWCALGTCDVTVKQACECQQDADCDKLDDGDLCNGTLYCAKTAGAKPICKPNPATVVVCKTVDDTACSKSVCQPKTGVCAMTQVSGPCSDGKACTVQDSCLNGQCAGLTKICSDGVACTVDSCQEPFGCVAVPGAPSVCSDGNPCTGDACDLEKGCVTSPVAGACDDGNPCTVKDTCTAGQCSGSSGGCDDGDPCTTDACSGGTCSHTAGTGGPCSDGNACTEGDACAAGKCAPGKAKVCSDDLVCTADSCDPATGNCAFSDQAGTLCDDKNPCTDEQCAPVFGCVHVNNAKACSDGDPCTLGEACKNGACAGGAANPCDDGNICTDDSCDPKKGGCVALDNSKPCNDGVGCTQNDVCKGGACTGTLLCDDKDPCTLDKCDLKTGKCAVLPFDNAPCDDLNPCTTAEICKGGVCGFGLLNDCSDGNACTDDACDKVKGCYSYPNTAPCSTGSCTLDDTCSGGSCKVGPTAGAGQVLLDPGPGNTTRTEVRGTLFSSDAMIAFGTALGSNFTNPDSTGVAWIAKGDFAGHWAWQQTAIGATGDSGKAIVQAFSNSLGGADVVVQSSAARPMMARIDGKGAVANLVTYAPPHYVHSTDAVKRAGKNDIVVVGYRNVAGVAYERGWLTVHSAVDLAITATAEFTGIQQDCAFYGATLGHDGESVAVVGHTAKGAYTYNQLFVLIGPDLNPANKKVTVLNLETTSETELRAVSRIPGGYIAAGTAFEVASGQATQLLVARFDELGNLLWNKNYQYATKSRELGWAVLGLADGSALVGAQFSPSLTAGLEGGVFLQRLDQSGNVLVSTLYSGPSFDFIYRLQQVTPGLIVASGIQSTGTTQKGWLLRTTPELQDTCATAGKCLQTGFSTCGAELSGGCNLAACNPTSGACTLTFVPGTVCSDGDACTSGDACNPTSKSCVATPVICDDKNPCTAETCGKLTGCVYSNLPNGTQCGGTKTCQAGVCQ